MVHSWPGHTCGRNPLSHSSGDPGHSVDNPTLSLPVSLTLLLWQVKAFLRGDALPYTPKEVSEVMSRAGSHQQDVNKTDREVRNYWLAVYFQQVETLPLPNPSSAAAHALSLLLDGSLVELLLALLLQRMHSTWDVLFLAWARQVSGTEHYNRHHIAADGLSFLYYLFFFYLDVLLWCLELCLVQQQGSLFTITPGTMPLLNVCLCCLISVGVGDWRGSAAHREPRA